VGEENLLSFSDLEENRLEEVYQRRDILRERGKEVKRELKQKSEDSVKILGEFLKNAEKVR